MGRKSSGANAVVEATKYDNGSIQVGSYNTTTGAFTAATTYNLPNASGTFVTDTPKYVYNATIYFIEPNTQIGRSVKLKIISTENYLPNKIAKTYRYSNLQEREDFISITAASIAGSSNNSLLKWTNYQSQSVPSVIDNNVRINHTNLQDSTANTIYWIEFGHRADIDFSIGKFYYYDTSSHTVDISTALELKLEYESTI